MAYQKLQTSRAAAVTPSDTVDIPNIASSRIRWRLKGVNSRW